MEYLITRNCMTQNGIVRAGQIVELTDREAQDLMFYGRCVPHDDAQAENRAVELENTSQTLVKRRGRRKSNAR